MYSDTAAIVDDPVAYFFNTRTAQGASRTTRSATDPINSRSKPLVP
jgi:hypothetical protein